MKRAFFKMQGLGNDFAVFDATREPLQLSSQQIRQLADRHFGIGFDQLLLVEPPQTPDTRFYYRIFNADGSEVEQCGNGARCFARFVHETGLCREPSISVGTARGNITLYHEADGNVRVNMGIPQFDPDNIPICFDQTQSEYSLTLDDQTLYFMAVSMGNPHMVIVVDDVATAPVATLGPRLESHACFAHRINVGFMAIDNRKAISLRVFERGSGETLACGSGACAAAVCGMARGSLDNDVVVSLTGGQLKIAWQGPGHPVWMSGPAETVFQGVIEL